MWRTLCVTLARFVGRYVSLFSTYDYLSICVSMSHIQLRSKSLSDGCGGKGQELSLIFFSSHHIQTKIMDLRMCKGSVCAHTKPCLLICIHKRSSDYFCRLVGVRLCVNVNKHQISEWGRQKAPLASVIRLSDYLLCGQRRLWGMLPAAQITLFHSKQSTQRLVEDWVMAQQGIVSIAPR